MVNTTKAARKAHGLSNMMTKLLGRALVANALMCSFVDGDERILLRFEGDGTGQLDLMETRGSRRGELVGYVSNPKLEAPTSTPVGWLLRSGTLSVTRVLYEQAKPFISKTKFDMADVETDLECYFRQSENRRAIVRLETALDATNEGNKTKLITSKRTSDETNMPENTKLH